MLTAWQRALERMVVGDIWEIYTPAASAYGTYGVKRDGIGPGEYLVFKLKLLEINCNNPEDQIPKNWVHPSRAELDAAKAKDAAATPPAEKTEL